jgi:hypothetical protein
MGLPPSSSTSASVVIFTPPNVKVMPAVTA